MKKNRLIFYAIFAAFHIFIFFFSVYVDSQRDNFQFLLTLQSKIWMIKYGSLIGIILLIVDFIWYWRGERVHKKSLSDLEQELNMLKAKLFDLQEASRRAPGPSNNPSQS